MLTPSTKQSKKSGNWITIDYIITDYKTETANTWSFSLKPIEFNFNSKEDWQWDGEWDNKPVSIFCKKGSTSNVKFSEGFPETFKDVAKKEIERILHQFN